MHFMHKPTQLTASNKTTSHKLPIHFKQKHQQHLTYILKKLILLSGFKPTVSIILHNSITIQLRTCLYITTHQAYSIIIPTFSLEPKHENNINKKIKIKKIKP